MNNVFKALILLSFLNHNYILANDSLTNNSLAHNNEYPGDSEVVAYVGANLINGTSSSVQLNSIILTSGNKIIAAGAKKDIKIPSNARIVKLENKWVVPGLIDTHVHFFESGRLYMNKTILAAATKTNALKEDQWVKKRLPYTLSRYICAGVTTAVSAGGPITFELQAKALSQQLAVAPRVLVAGGPISNTDVKQMTFLNEPATFAATNEIEMRKQIRKFSEQGVDLIKLGYLGAMMGMVDAPTIQAYSAVLKAGADESHRLGMNVLTHIMTHDSMGALLSSELDAFAHIPFDKEMEDDLVSKIIHNNIAIGPTLAFHPRRLDVFNNDVRLLPIESDCSDPEVLATYDDPEFIDLKKNIADKMQQRVKLFQQNMSKSVKKFSDAGGKLVVGSDSSHVGTPHGTSIHLEMMYMEQAGISASDIIMSATKNAAELVGKGNELGTIEPGKLADFIVLDANPLETIANLQKIKFVVKDGKQFDHSALITTNPGTQFKRPQVK